MKTQFYYKYLLTAVLMLMAGQVMHAQDAFYIYRNDGEFNGFFYDDVKRIGYSKFDIDSIEHDVYVVQDVELADTIYRIPLAAIDSVGFVQPEIIYNPRLRRMDDEGMTAFLQSNEGMTLFFDKSLPIDKRPKANDVLVCFDWERFAGGFGGKVRNVSEKSDGIVVQCDSIDSLGDLFQQFITVEQIVADEGGNMARRIAGVPSSNLRKVAGNTDLTLFNLNTTLHKSLKESDRYEVTLDLGLKLVVRATAVYNIGMSSFYTKLMLTEELGVDAGITADFKMGESLTFPFTGKTIGVKFPATLPIFEVRPIPDAFVRCEGHLKGSFNYPVFSGSMTQSITIDNGDVYGSWTNDDHPADNNPNATFQLEMNGFFQTGVHQDFSLHTNEWLHKVIDAQIGLDVYTGPKLSGNITLDAGAAMEGNVYGALYNTSLEFTKCAIDYEATSKVWFLWYDPKGIKFMDGSIGLWQKTLHLFPEFRKTEVDINDTNLQATIRPRGDICWSWPIGVGIVKAYTNVYDHTSITGDKPLMLKYNEKENYSLWNTWDRFSASFDISSLPIGDYVAAPYIRFMGRDIYAEPYTVFHVKPYIKVACADTIFVDGEPSETRISFMTNCDSVAIDPIFFEGDDDAWAEFSVEKNTIIIKTTKRNNTVSFRDIPLIVKCFYYNGNGEMLSFSDTRDIRILQTPKGKYTKVYVDFMTEYNTQESEKYRTGEYLPWTIKYVPNPNVFPSISELTEPVACTVTYVNDSIMQVTSADTQKESDEYVHQEENYYTSKSTCVKEASWDISLRINLLRKYIISGHVKCNKSSTTRDDTDGIDHRADYDIPYHNEGNSENSKQFAITFKNLEWSWSNDHDDYYGASYDNAEKLFSDYITSFTWREESNSYGKSWDSWEGKYNESQRDYHSNYERRYNNYDWHLSIQLTQEE